jgi:hypothetical protein
MTYSKPEVDVLGDAKVVIESMQPKPGSSTDNQGSNHTSTPAYDLDE